MSWEPVTRESTRMILAALLTAGSFVVAQSWRDLLSLYASRAYGHMFCRTDVHRRSRECRISLQRQENTPAPVLVFETTFTTLMLAAFIVTTKYTMGSDFGKK
jgi:hypothetical protein